MRFIVKYSARPFLYEWLRCSWLLCLLFFLLPNRGFAQNRYDILITECLPDPSPVVGLPESSFVEITNRSQLDYDLLNWKISNGSSMATIKESYVLKADSMLILCPTSSSAAFSSFGAVLGISGFPALNNSSGDIILFTETGAVMHAIHYEKRWFGNDIKSAGGWSLEMIDLSNPCGGLQNWSASVSPAGGTPGVQNSVKNINPDDQPPSLTRAFAGDSLNIFLFFDEPMNSLSASDISNYAISEGIGQPAEVHLKEPFFDRAEMKLSTPLLRGKVYSAQAHGVRDDAQNEISLKNSCSVGLCETAAGGDVVCNEILFNPPPYGFDYLELYNRSSKIIDCSQLLVAGRDGIGALKDPAVITKENRALFPDEYIVLTENSEWLLRNYPLADSLKTILFPAMPSMPDDMGKIVLLNNTGEQLDELDYDHHWHSPLTTNESGVALERIRSGLPTSLSTNWTSAATDAGYGTPGYKNSENYNDNFRDGAHFISLESKVFSPDMDGYQDFCFIHYQLPDAGYIGSISIYDITGRMVRSLVNNNLLGSSGSFRWDGLDDQNKILPMGHYIIYWEAFRPDGSIKRGKLVCVLAR